MEKLTPRLTASVLSCIRSTAPSLLIQKAAVQALRKMENTDEVREVLLQTFLDDTAPGDKRLAAYLMLMRSPSQSDVRKITKLLPGEQNEQVKNFVASHIANILKSEDLNVQSVKELVKEALKNSQLPTVSDFKTFSRNYHFSKSVSLPSHDPISAAIEGNLIFDPNNYLPKESMLKTTLTVFGFAPTDLFEVSLRLKKSLVFSAYTVNRSPRERGPAGAGTRIIRQLVQYCHFGAFFFPAPCLPARGSSEV